MKSQHNLPWKTEREFYDLHSNDLFSQFEFYHVALIGNSAKEFLANIVKRARIRKGAHVLDLGCGSGYLVNELNKTGEAFGISTSSACVEYCRKRYSRSSYSIGNMESFKQRNRTHVLALESIGYADPVKTMQVTFSNLAPKGYFYIKDWCRYEHESIAQTINRKTFENYWKYYPKTVARMIQIASRCGFELIEYHDLTGKTNYKFFNETIPFHLREFTLPFPNIWVGVAAEFLFQKPG